MLRPKVIIRSALVLIAGAIVAPAAGTAQAVVVASQPQAATAGARFAEFSSDSCVPSDNPQFPYFCEAVGEYLNGRQISGLAEFTNGTTWGQNSFVPIPPRGNQIMFENEVSCAPVASSLPDCLFVGQHYNAGAAGAQLAEWGGPSGFQVVDWRNPKGAKLSSLDDVSCPSTTFCVTTGLAGTSGRKYHATWFTWNGTRLAEKAIPEPAHSRQSQLSALSCATTTTCVAAGDYLDRAGKWRPYAEVWTHGSWRIESTPTVAHESGTFIQGLSCPAASECMAVGEASGPSTRAFAESWNGAKWRMTTLPAGSRTALFGVSCPTATTCFAAGSAGQQALVDTWNGTAWRRMTAARSPAPRAGDVLFHVSCVSATSCLAVGYRYDSKVKNSDLTLAEIWNGATWRVQAALNN